MARVRYGRFTVRVVRGDMKMIGKEPIQIGNRLELFVDSYLIETMKGVSLKLHHPIPREVALDFDAPWEGPWSGYVTVFEDAGRYRLYYRGAAPGQLEYVCYAESNDGVVWKRPSLGIVEFAGSTRNNILWTGHNFAPFKDGNPAAPDSERYKAVLLGSGEGVSGLLALASSDGLHWRLLVSRPVITEGAFDSQNVAFWEPERQEYACYSRAWSEGKSWSGTDVFRGVRLIQRCTSPDFINWTKPEVLDYGGTPLEHFYTSAVTPYFRAPHILLAFPMRFVPGRKPAYLVDTRPREVLPEAAVTDAVFMTSRDGLHWDRSFLEAFLRPGCDAENWTDRSNMVAWGILPTGKDEISIYWVEHYKYKTCRLRRGTLRTDGFISVNAPYGGGELITKPLVFSGDRLVLNYATSAAGSIRVEIQDADGKPIPGFTLDESMELYGDEIEGTVSYKISSAAALAENSGLLSTANAASGQKSSGEVNSPGEVNSSVGALAGRPVRLRFVMKDADLYSIRFANAG